MNIQEIADALRHLLATDNDARRHIHEFILPLVDINCTAEELEEMNDLEDKLDDLIAAVEDYIEDPKDALDALKDALEEARA